MIVFSRFLRYFTEVARMGSIRKASEQLNVAASAINRQILQAETAFGMPLFERLPSGLRLTAAGEMLLNSAQQWRRDFERLQARMGDLSGLRTGHVRIAVIDALSQGFVSRAVRDMREDFPGVIFTLDVLGNTQVMEQVVAGEADFGLMLNPQTTRDVRVHAHVDVHLGFVVRPGHPLAAGPTARFNQCADHAMVMPGEPLALAEQVRALQSASGVAVHVAATADSIQMIKSLVADGLGIGVLTGLDVMQEVERGELAFVRIADAMIRPLTLALCVAQARQLSLAANLFLKRLEAGFERFAGTG